LIQARKAKLQTCGSGSNGNGNSNTSGNGDGNEPQHHLHAASVQACDAGVMAAA